MIFITFEKREKTCSKIEKKLVSISSLGGKKKQNSKTNEKIQKQSSRRVYKKGVFKNFAKFTGKHLRWSLFLTELQV